MVFSVIISKSSGKGAEAATGSVLWKKLLLKILQLSQENYFVEVSFWYSCGPEGLELFKKETSAEVFSCGYCVTFKNTYFEEYLRTAASEKEALI